MVSRGLAYWSAAVKGPVVEPDAYAEFVSHPRFEDACRLLVARMFARTRSDNVFARAAKDVSRYFFGYFVLYLDARGGVTLSTIRDFCKELGLVGHGRAEAILLRLRMIGYLQPNTDPKDRRVRRYLPTEGMREAYRLAHRDELGALALMVPEAEIAARRLDEPDFFRAYVLRAGQGIADIIMASGNRQTSLFDVRNAGSMILFDIASSGEPGDVYPAKGRVKMSVTELARKYEVSRSHVLKLLRDAEKEGLLRRNPDEQTGELSQVLRDAIVALHVAQLLGNAACAYAAIKSTSEAAVSIAAS